MIKNRSIALCILFTFLTCGIYGLYWMASINNDINKIANRAGQSGATIVLLTIFTCGIYGWVWMYNSGDTLDRVRVANGEPANGLVWLYILLAVFGLSIVSYALIQSEINRYAQV